jgi:hypothetical protein
MGFFFENLAATLFSKFEIVHAAANQASLQRSLVDSIAAC